MGKRDCQTEYYPGANLSFNVIDWTGPAAVPNSNCCRDGQTDLCRCEISSPCASGKVGPWSVPRPSSGCDAALVPRVATAESSFTLLLWDWKTTYPATPQSKSASQDKSGLAFLLFWAAAIPPPPRHLQATPSTMQAYNICMTMTTACSRTHPAPSARRTSCGLAQHFTSPSPISPHT